MLSYLVCQLSSGRLCQFFHTSYLFGTVGEDYLQCRCDSHFIQRLGTSLRFNIEICHSVNLIAPKLDTHRLFVLYGEDIYYRTSHSELCCAFYLVGLGISCSQQSGRKRLGVDRAAVLDNEGVLSQGSRRYRSLQTSFHACRHYPAIARCYIRKRSYTPVFVFTGYALHICEVHILSRINAGYLFACHLVHIRYHFSSISFVCTYKQALSKRGKRRCQHSLVYPRNARYCRGSITFQQAVLDILVMFKTACCF